MLVVAEKGSADEECGQCRAGEERGWGGGGQGGRWGGGGPGDGDPGGQTAGQQQQHRRGGGEQQPAGGPLRYGLSLSPPDVCVELVSWDLVLLIGLIFPRC